MLRTLSAAVVVAAAWSGCGGTEERASAPRAAATATATAVATATAAPSAAPASVAAKATVAIRGFSYSPARVTVRRGGRVTWTDEDASNHTVSFDRDGPRDVENLREGRSASVTFDKTGSYAYVCDFHPGMAGTVEVR